MPGTSPTRCSAAPGVGPGDASARIPASRSRAPAPDARVLGIRIRQSPSIPADRWPRSGGASRHLLHLHLGRVRGPIHQNLPGRTLRRPDHRSLRIPSRSLALFLLVRFDLFLALPDPPFGPFHVSPRVLQLSLAAPPRRFSISWWWGEPSRISATAQSGHRSSRHGTPGRWGICRPHLGQIQEPPVPRPLPP